MIPKQTINRKKQLLLSILFGVGIIIALQLLYPKNVALPFMRIDDIVISGQSQSAIQALLQQRYDQPARFSADGSFIAEARPHELGVIPRYAETTARALEYSFFERLMPFSLFIKPLFASNMSVQYRIDVPKLHHFVKEKLLPACTRKPINATLKVVNDDIMLSGEVIGRNCSEKAIADKIVSTPFNKNIALPVKKIAPTNSSVMVAPLAAEAKEKIKRGLVLLLEAEQKAIEPATLASWMVIEEDPTTHTLKLGLDNSKIKSYIQEIDASYRLEAEPTRIFTLDGLPTRTVDGREGRAINIDMSVSAITAAFNEAASQTPAIATIIISKVTVPTEYVRNYGDSQAGLQLLLQDLAREKGMYGITVMELSGKQRQAQANGDHIFTTASTYKMFVAYTVLKDIEAGTIRWQQQIREGMDTVECFDEMIKYSLNPCSWAFKDMVGGWARIQSHMNELGLTNTFLVQNNLRSTSNDEALFLRKLEEGTSLQGDSRQFLLHLFRNQIYRKGIPSGVQWPVANKIGFLDGFLHDVAIVYAPKGTYILAVMTDGGSWWQIADVAKRVDAVMQQ